MQTIPIAISLVIFVGGVLLGWLLARTPRTTAEALLKQAEANNRDLEQKLTASVAHEADLNARLESERMAAQEKWGLLDAQVRSQAAELQGLREKVTVVTAKEAEVTARLQTGQTAAQGLNATFEAQIREQESELRALRTQVTLLTAQKTELATRSETERSAVEEKLRLLSDAERRLSDAFKAVSADALSRNNQAFLDIATVKLSQVETSVRADLEKRQQAISELVTPVRTSLEKVDDKIQQLDRVREGAYSELREQVRSLGDGQTKLQAETAKLVNALRAPAVRGRWGEIQLQRVVEMAGMLEHCDFFTQPTAEGDEGRLRPDLLVRLPGGKSIVVDAKAPLSAYLKAMDAVDDEGRKALMKDHALQVRAHLYALGRKSYAAQFQPAPDFVVLFLPGESFFSAALENDPTLIEFGLDQNVVLATPTTLIALLRTAAYGWQQESLARNAAEISAIGRELYRRISSMVEHWTKVGVNLGRAVHAYNYASNALESRVLVSARKFEDLKTAPAGIEIRAVVPVERTVGTLGVGDLAPDSHPQAPDAAEEPPYPEIPATPDEAVSTRTPANVADSQVPALAVETNNETPSPDPRPPDGVNDAVSVPWWKQDLGVESS